MPAADFAPLAKTDRRLVVGADVFCALSDFQRGWRPQRKRIHRTRGPVPTGLAMAIAHGGRFAADRELHRAAKAGSRMCVVRAHDASPQNIFVVKFRFKKTAA